MAKSLNYFHRSAGTQDFGSTCFPGFKQGAGWKIGAAGLEPVPILDLGACKFDGGP